MRENLNAYTVRWEDEFPLSRTEYRKLYLDGTDRRLKFSKNNHKGKVMYGSADGNAEFVFTFQEDTELTGYLNLKLWVSSNESNDMDLFITVRKLDRNGHQVLFDNCHVPAKWPMALGWLRLSHRELDGEKSTPWEPYLKSVVGPGQKVKPGEIVSCEIPVLPTSTLFRQGETLKLDISGIYRGGESIEVPFGYTDTVNKGIHAIYTGAEYDSNLLIPIS
jgi:predicted acyl esterase